MIYRLKIQALTEGLITYLPGCKNILMKKTTGTDSAEYCYSVWLRHEVRTHPYRDNEKLDTVVELGPGDSLGSGISALFAGNAKYIALDVVRYANKDRNLNIADRLAALFARHVPIPGSKDFPEAKPWLDSYHFPQWLSDLSESFIQKRRNQIVKALAKADNPASLIAYISPREASKSIPEKSVDFIFSQAVLEHVDDLDGLYRNCYRWLTPGGIMSHQIDFKSHGTATTWDGHWTYPSFLWKMIRGRRAYIINRQPCSKHLQIIKKHGFEIIELERYLLRSTLKKRHIAKRFRFLNPKDLTTAGAYIIARKPVNSKSKGVQSCVE